MKATDYVPTKRLFAAFKGEPGSGKSIAASSWALQGKVKILDWDNKFGAIHNFYTNIIKQPEHLANIEYEQPKTYNEGGELLEQWVNDNNFNKEGNTIIDDSLTIRVDKMLVDVAHIKGMDPDKKGKLKFVGGIQVSDIEDFNAETSALTKLVVNAKAHMRCNYIMIAHVVQVRQNLLDGGVKTSRQLITAGKKIAAKLPAYFDEIYHFDFSTGGLGDSGPAYTCFTSHSGEDFARTSLPLPVSFNFTNNKLLYPQWIKELKYDKLGS